MARPRRLPGSSEVRVGCPPLGRAELGGGMVNFKSPKMTEPERSTHTRGVDKLWGTHADTIR